MNVTGAATYVYSQLSAGNSVQPRSEPGWPGRHEGGEDGASRTVAGLLAGTDNVAQQADEVFRR